VKVLLTGASGFVGRHALQGLRARGLDVHAVTRHPSVAASNGTTWHQADLLSENGRDAVLEAVQPEAMLHCAWYAVPGLYWRSSENLRWLAASLDLCREFAARGGRRLVVCGTCAEYEWRNDVSMYSEATTPLVPDSLYGTATLALCQTLESLARTSASISVGWGRLFWLYGPGEDPKRLVAGAVRSLLAGEPVNCSEGLHARDFLHAADAGDALAALLVSGVNGPVNIGSGAAVRVRDLVSLLTSLAGRPDLCRFGAQPNPTNEPHTIVADTTRLRHEVGWNPRWPLDEGLRDTLTWWRARVESGKPRQP
jgi:nucleoside-diphosphate-sugar epimerase